MKSQYSYPADIVTATIGNFLVLAKHVISERSHVVVLEDAIAAVFGGCGFVSINATTPSAFSSPCFFLFYTIYSALLAAYPLRGNHQCV